MQAADTIRPQASLNKFNGAKGKMEVFIRQVNKHSAEIDELNEPRTAESWISEAEGIIEELEGIANAIR